MDSEDQNSFSNVIMNTYGVDSTVLNAVIAGDGDINYKELLLGMFRGIDELVSLGLLDEEAQFGAKIEIANALNWAGPKIRSFDNCS